MPTQTPQLSVDDFAGRIKAKYPEYSNLDNQTLASKMLAKYPQYQNVVQQPQQKGSGLWNALGNVVDVGLPIAGGVVGGIAGLASGIPTLGVTAPVGAAAGAGIGATAGTALANVFDQLTGRRKLNYAQAVGEPLLMGGATAASGGAAQALGPLKGVGGFLARTGAQAGVGAGFGAGNAVVQGHPEQIGQQAGIGALFGGTLNAAGEGLGYAFGKQGLPRDITESALPKMPVGDASKDVAGTIMNYKPGTVTSLLSQAQGKISSLQSKIEPLLQEADSLTSVGSPVSKDSFVQGLMQNYPNATFGEDFLKSTLQKLVPDQGKLLDKLFVDGLTNVEADTLKKALYQNSRIGKVFQMQLENPSIVADVGTNASLQLANMVKDNMLPEGRQLFAEQGQHIVARNALDKLAKQKGSTFRALMGGLIGTAAFGPLGGVPGVVAEKAIDNPSVRLGGANLLSRIGASAPLQVPAQLGPSAKIEMLQRLLGQNPNQTPPSQ